MNIQKKEGFCPYDSNNGFVELVGPIQTLDLKDITVNSYPLSISFAPKTTIPSLIGNRIDESIENTCTYREEKFSLADIQICNNTHKGYNLPGVNEKPVAELILTFFSKKSEISGILLCLPIYDSGKVSHDTYLSQLIDIDIPSCTYNNNIGSEYIGNDYNNIQNSTLNNCIKSCCGDPNCLAYTFKKGTCYLKKDIPSIKKTNDTDIISGTINHSELSKPLCTDNKKKQNKKDTVANLQTLFYEDEKDISQTSIAYKTCIETINNNRTPSYKTLYVVVFPNGIHLTQQVYQQLLIQIGGSLKNYMLPPVITNGEQTLKSYNFDDNGNKKPITLSKEGHVYRTPVSSCTDEFKQKFEYFQLPPRLPTIKFQSDICPYYKTTEYKCVPFNQLKDLSGNYVIQGNKTLDTILYEKQQIQQADIKIQSGTITTEKIEGIVAGVLGFSIAALLAIKIGSWLSKNA